MRRPALVAEIGEEGSATVAGRRWLLVPQAGAVLALLVLAGCGGKPAPTAVAPPLNYVPHAIATAGIQRPAQLAIMTPTGDPRPTAAEPTVPTVATTLAATAAVPLPGASTLSNRASGDSRLGVVFDALQPDAAANALRLLHVQWFDGAATGLPERPATQLQSVGDDLTALAQQARQYPGRTWTFHVEPNGFAASTPMGKPAGYARRLHDVAQVLHAADPTARLLGPEVLDWSNACTGCSGMPTGKAWSEEMRQDYLNAYGQELPFDIWAIHTYPLDWQHLPTVNYPEMEQQLVDCRQWLDSIPTLRGKPIWDTELGAHWGYTAYQFSKVNGQSTLMPAGQLRSDLVQNYLHQFLSWLNTNAVQYGVQRWFIWAAYNPDVPGDHAGAISLLDGPGPNAHLTSYGRIVAAAGP